MKRNIFDFLSRYCISIVTLIIFSILIIFIANVINNHQIHYIFNSNNLVVDSNNYQDFLIKYYQTQADWINRWLTFLGLMLAISGIAIPLLLNASYKEKNRELQKEIIKYKKMSLEQELKIKNLTKTFNDDYNKKIANFKSEMKRAIQKSEKDAVFAKLDILVTESERASNKKMHKEKVEKYNTIIKLAESSLKEFDDDNKFKMKIYSYLKSAYFHRGLDFQIYKEQYKNAISDFNQCRYYNEKLSYEDSDALLSCLLECYILTKQYKDGIQILENFDSINKEKVDGTQSGETDIIGILKSDSSDEAQELLKKLERIIVE